MNASPSKTVVPRDELAYNVKDLLVFCLQHWRSMLTLMLVGALLFGLLSGVSTYRSERSTREPLTHSYEEYLAMDEDGALSDREFSIVSYGRQNDAVSAIDRKYAKLTYDLDHSLLMQIDPTAVATATATVVILPSDAGDLSAAGNLLLAYRSALLNGAYLDELAETLATKGEYLRELISVSIGGQGGLAEEGGSADSNMIRDRIRRYNGFTYPYIASSAEDTPAIPSSVLELRVIAAEPGLAEQLMDALLAELDALLPQLRQSVALHTVTILNRTVSVQNDSALMDAQLERQLSCSDLQALRNQYVLRLSQIDIPTTSTGSAQSAAWKAGVKRGVLAAVAVLLIYGLLLCLRYLFSERPLTEVRFRQHYRLLPLAAFRSVSSAVYRRRTPFDRWLRRSGRMLVDEQDTAAVYDLAAGNLRLYGGELGTVLISGPVSAEDKLALAAAMEQRLSGAKFTVVSDLIDIRERMKLAGADGVIFYESFDTTRFPRLNEELALVERAGVRILGSVLQ